MLLTSPPIIARSFLAKNWFDIVDSINIFCYSDGIEENLHIWLIQSKT